eukprot:359606-Chlamydomonas_euryale.AAC.6
MWICRGSTLRRTRQRDFLVSRNLRRRALDAGGAELCLHAVAVLLREAARSGQGEVRRRGGHRDLNDQAAYMSSKAMCPRPCKRHAAPRAALTMCFDRPCALLTP